MKRTPLKRYKALVSKKLRRTPRCSPGTPGEGGSAALASTTPEEAFRPPRRPRPTRPHRFAGNVRAIVVSRSGGRCEIGIDGCWGTARELHHRVSQKMGGRHREAAVRSDRPSNIVHLCGSCHVAVTNHPKWARRWGWVLREHQDPAQEKVLYRGDWVFVSDGGEVTPCEEVGT